MVGLISLPASLPPGVLWQSVGPWSGFGAAAPFAFGAATAGLAAILLVWTVPSGAQSV